MSADAQNRFSRTTDEDSPCMVWNDLGSLRRRLQAALGPEDLSLLHVHDAVIPACYYTVA